MSLRFALATYSLAVLLIAPAGAATIQLAATIDGAQANSGAGTGSTATGSATLTFDDQTNLLTWSYSFSGLLGDFQVAHFHGPAPANQNGAVIFTTPVVLNPGNRSGTSNGSQTLTPTEANDLLAGLWYINVHSVFNGLGEIRGNVSVVPEPVAATLLGLALLSFPRRRAGS